jgi:hypothetical protein
LKCPRTMIANPGNGLSKSVKRKTGHQKKKPFFGGIRPHALGV